MYQIWLRTTKNDKLIDNRLFDFEKPQSLSELSSQACNELDYPSPVVLNKHEKEYSEFNLAMFTCGDFVESVPFERLVIEYVPEDEDEKSPH